MAAGRTLCHTAKKLETFPLHKIMSCEELRQQCFKTGIPEEEAVQRTLMHYFHATDTETIRTAFGNGYREMKGFGKKSGFSKEQEATFRLEEFLKRRYEFRFNTVLDEGL